MRKGIRAALAAIVFFPCLLSAGTPVRVVTWNLEWFPGGSPRATPTERRSHMAKAQAALLALDPDVLCLQEVRDWQSVAELVSVLPGCRVNVVSRFDGDQQQAIASKLPADSSWAEAWKSGEASNPPRGYSFAALRLPDHSFLLVYSVHLKANSGGTDAGNIAKREESSRQLLAHVADMQKLYGLRGRTAVVLAGDWNTTLDDSERFVNETTLRSLLAAGFHTTWDGVPFERRITHPGSSRYPSITFDHILTRGLGKPAAGLGKGGRVSDHQPVAVAVAPAATVRAPVPLRP